MLEALCYTCWEPQLLFHNIIALSLLFLSTLWASAHLVSFCCRTNKSHWRLLPRWWAQVFAQSFSSSASLIPSFSQSQRCWWEAHFALRAHSNSHKLPDLYYTCLTLVEILDAFRHLQKCIAKCAPEVSFCWPWQWLLQVLLDQFEAIRSPPLAE